MPHSCFSQRRGRVSELPHWSWVTDKEAACQPLSCTQALSEHRIALLVLGYGLTVDKKKNPFALSKLRWHLTECSLACLPLQSPRGQSPSWWKLFWACPKPRLWHLWLMSRSFCDLVLFYLYADIGCQSKSWVHFLFYFIFNYTLHSVLSKEQHKWQTKQKQTHRHREQTDGCQRPGVLGVGWKWWGDWEVKTGSYKIVTGM